jgi:acetyl esterase/lipase
MKLLLKNMMKAKWIGLLVCAAVVCPLGAAPVEWTLWPQGAVEPEGFQAEPEAEVVKEPDDGVRRLSHVSVPTVTVYRPAPEKANGTAVLVCPGGGYNILAMDHEGTQVCEWLNSLGVTAALLKYRVPRRDPQRPFFYPLQDAQRAMGLLRNRAEELGIAKDRIGVLGFSAGGNLSVMLALHRQDREYALDPELDAEDARPNFLIPIYPAYLATEDLGGLVEEIQVRPESPPVCLIHADNDRITAAGSAMLYLEYKKRNVPAELHIYQRGGHGFGMKQNGDPINEWPARVEAWMRGFGWLEPMKK